VKVRLFITSCLLILAASLPGAADRPIKPSNKPWASLEQELAEKGIPKDTPSVVKAALSSPNSDIRWVAVELLGMRGELSAKGALHKILLNDDSLLVRETAALALARLNEPGALQDLKSFMQSAEDPARRLFLATRLAELGDPSGYPQIVKAATAKDEHLRFLSVESVIRVLTLNNPVPEPDPGSLLNQLMSDDSSTVRKEAVFQLSVVLFQGFSIQPYLEKIERIAKQDPDAEVRKQAETLLTSWKEFGNPRTRSEQ
jgi:HEAT repeat protein